MESIDQILNGRTSLRKLRPVFGSWEDVLHFYAEEMSKKFSACSRPMECQICHQAPATEKIVYEWQAHYDTRDTLLQNAALIALIMALGHLLHYETESIEFFTDHWFCKSCWHHLLWRQTGAKIVTNACIVMLVIASIVLVSTADVLCYFVRTAATHGEILSAEKVALIRLAVCIVALMGTRVFRAFGFPKALIGLGKSPFSYVSRSRE